MPEPIDVPELRPKPPLPASVMVTTAGLASAAILTIGWLAVPLVVGTVVLVLVSLAGALVATGAGACKVSSTTPKVPPAARAAARTAVRTIAPRPAPAPPPAGRRGGATGWTGWGGTGGSYADSS